MSYPSINVDEDRPTRVIVVQRPTSVLGAHAFAITTVCGLIALRCFCMLRDRRHIAETLSHRSEMSNSMAAFKANVF